MAALPQSNTACKNRANTDYSIRDFHNWVCICAGSGRGKVFLWDQDWTNARLKCSECVSRDINIMQLNKLPCKTQRNLIKRFKSLMTAFITTGTPWLQEEVRAKQTSVWPTLCCRIQSILRHGRHDELQMNSLVSVGAEQIRPCDWTRPGLHIWEIAKARLVLPSLPPTCENNLIALQAF